MACNCYDEIKETLKDSLKSHMDGLEYGAVRVSANVNFDGAVFNLNAGDNSPLTIKINSSFRAIKKNGEPKQNLTKLENRIRVKFCPFCGTEHTGV